MPSSGINDVYRLARSLGVQTSFVNAMGTRRNFAIEPILAVLRALGCPIEKPGDASGLLRAAQAALSEWAIEPVHVMWDGRPTTVVVTLGGGRPKTLRCAVDQENGERLAWSVDVADMLPVEQVSTAGVTYQGATMKVPELPLGYHNLRIEYGSRELTSLLIAAPTRAYQEKGKRWGVFAPLYALHNEKSWGAGGLAELQQFADWIHERNGHFVATLPLLPIFMEPELFSPSPYSPVSRLFWNEFYIDVDKAAHLPSSHVADWLSLETTEEELQRIRSQQSIDYQGIYRLKRSLLELLPAPSEEPSEELFEYAQFRAVQTRQKKPWRDWPAHLKEGRISPADYDPLELRFHLTAQDVVTRQINDLAATLAARDQQFYLDLPIGAHAHGFDTWKYQSLFAHDAECGAPPDKVFTSGQAWGLPPAIPAAARKSGYQYFRAVLNHHLKVANIVRIDHMIGLHRLFWVPKGFSASDGVYVQNKAEETYAILCLESWRRRAVIVGENLGTVPRYINAMMARHGIHETYVLQYEIPTEAGKPIRAPMRRSFAGLNTHDMSPFAGFLQAADIDLMEELQVRAAEDAHADRTVRAIQLDILFQRLEADGFLKAGDRDPEHIFRACLAFLTSSPAQYVVINLEDLWLEIQGHNVPGTAEGNWMRPSVRPLHDLPSL